MKPREAIVLRLLRAAADGGKRCPTNGELADELGGSSVSVPVKAINTLVEMGLITVQRLAQTRVVTIVETGRSTAT